MFRWLFILLPLFAAVNLCAQQTQEHRPYSKARLEATIARYESQPQQNTWRKLPGNLLLRPGDTSHAVPLLQNNLLLTGDLKADTAATGQVYNAAITTAVRRFQQRHGLVTDGIVGPNTLRALNVSPAQRLLQLRLNLTRFDSVLATIQSPYAIINLPEYQLTVVDSGKTILSSRVIIGKPSLPTHTIYSELDLVVLHPYWYVPTSISVKEIVPILRRDPGYLSRNGMKLEKPTPAGWIRVNPWRVNWNQIDASNFNYRIVQLEGEQNELGHVKFPFPNSLPQYLHDTPSKALFDYPKRAFSHGCIRVEKPVELAYYLLSRGSGYATEKIDRLWFRYKPNHYIRVKEPIPLLIVYLTAWVDAQGDVQFREDLYGHDVIPRLPLQNGSRELETLRSGN